MNGVKHNKLPHLLLLASTTLLYIAVICGHAFALDVPRDLINNVSPSANVTTTNGPSENDNWHNMVLSEHGKVQKVVVGMYFTTKSDKVFKINVNTARGCNINGLGGSFPVTSKFVYIKVEGQPKIGIPGDKICSTGTGKLDNMSFAINSTSLTDATNDTAMHRATVTIEWVDRSDEGAYQGIRGDLAKRDGGYGSRFWFKFRTMESESRVGYVNTDQSNLGEPNNSLIFSKQTGNQDGSRAYTDMYFPFGPSCSAGRTTNRAVTLYDADNGTASQTPPLGFYVGTVESNGKVTPLKAEEYVGSNGDKDDITVNEAPDDNNRIANDGSSLGNLRQGGPNRPIFYPSNFHNEGGSTTVKIKEFKKKTHYVLVAEGVHQGQFVYVGLPGDAIFGSPDFDYNDPKYCKATSGVNISPRVEINAEYEPGERATVKAFVGNSSEPLQPGNSKYHRIFWYERDRNDIFTGADGVIQNRQPGTGPDRITWSLEETEIEAGNPNWTTVIPPNTNEARICTSLELLDPDSSTTIDPTSQTRCANIVKKPYFKATLGDVNAAAGWGSSCGASNGKISAFNSGAAGGFKGSGAQVAAFSAGIINQFTSGIPPKGLTFANTIAANNPYGGGFEYTYCIPDYLQGVIASNSPDVPCSSDNVVTNGNVFVSANCANVASVGVGNVPNLRWVIAKNIYIGKNVKNLDGIYIAKENIYTCSESLNNVVKLPDLATQCDKQLTVRGAMVAGGIIKLQRTYQSLLQNPAEVIEYNPFVWLSAINSPPDSTRTTHKFDYITALPPVL